ncbi:MAG: endopeptidase La [Chloroflexota bacterium]|nr:MAG: endopeptidase La [Chloroflexota bacterium]
MPASRWNTEIFELLEWIEKTDLVVRDAFSEVVLSNILNGNEDGKIDREEEDTLESIPEVLPVLPLRGLVVYPYTAVPLTIGQPRSIRLVNDVLSEDERLVALIASRDPNLENPGPEELYSIGTVATVHRLFRAPDGTIRLLVQGITRFKIQEFVQETPYLKAKIELCSVALEESLEIEAMVRKARDQFSHVAEMIPAIPRELVEAVTVLENPLQVTYNIASFQHPDLEDAQELLELDTISDKLHKLVNLMTREVEVLEIGQKIQRQARSEIEKVQREYFLREQLKAIRTELGENDEQTAEVEEFRQKIEDAKMSEEAQKQAFHEVERMSRIPTASAEYGVIRTYLDWMVSLPWSKTTEDKLAIGHAREVLNEDHYGLENVKERILEFLAVRKLRKERSDELETQYEDDIRQIREGVILCFVGPPGVGKTSLGRSIARALGRKFIRASLGGVRDEAEIRGHRRTYIGALPGRIIQSLRRIESNNPVFMLDEIDKLGQGFQGDPTSALLEVLDPEQNSEFRDHYLEVAYDLSKAMFITTANLLEPIPAPLRDRMEIIRLSGYTDKEKKAIAEQYLIPRQIRENGLRFEEISFSEDALQTIIRSYTREAGVRNLERELGSVCRKVVTKIAEGEIESLDITPEKVREFLGRPKFFGTEEIAARISIPGVAAGLAWTSTGGEMLFVEATQMPGSNKFQLTGSLGEVMKESAQAALSYVRSRANEFGISDNFFATHDIHLHVPSGAQPKDGPSAGVTMATALVSLVSGRLVQEHVSMTGEITLRGQVLPVGGIKEKVLAAYRAGSTTVLLPKRNEADLEDLPEEVLEVIDFVFVETVDDVLDAALEKETISAHPTSS